MRLEITPADERTSAQADAAAAVLNGPRGKLAGPLLALVEHPQLCTPVQQLGRMLRYEGVLSARLRELATLVTASVWRASYEWRAHAPLARAAGLGPHMVDAIGRGEDPELSGVELEVYRFCRALHERRSVTDAELEPLLSVLGNDGVLELVALCGYYSMIAMVLDVAGIRAEDATPAAPHSNS